MSEAEERALAEFTRASNRIKQAPTFREGGPGAENAYSEAYRQMARLGMVMPLRKKYR